MCYTSPTMKTTERRVVYEGDGGEGEPPVSRAEQLMKAHPDILARRDDGAILIHQILADQWRNIEIEVQDYENSQEQNPPVLLWADNNSLSHHNFASRYYRGDDEEPHYGLYTFVRVHVDEGGQLTPEVGYSKRYRYPRHFTRRLVQSTNKYAVPIPARDLVATARIGLEMLQAYGEASPEQQERIAHTLSGFEGEVQLVNNTHPGYDDWLRSEDIYTHIDSPIIYALNVLNKVTDAMLPGEMPPAPKNRRETRQRPRRRKNPAWLRTYWTEGPGPIKSPAPGRQPAGR